MKRLTAKLLATFLMVFGAKLAFATPLSAPISFQDASRELGYELDTEIWGHRAEFLKGIDDNLRYLSSSPGAQAYRSTVYHNNDGSDISRERIAQSLSQFRSLVVNAKSKEELRRGLQDGFVLYRSLGRDGRGSVGFTGYYQPTYQASRVRTSEYRYPIYRMPSQFNSWTQPHPTRVNIEGYDGLGNCRTCFRGTELAWLKSRYEVFMIHVQGSAILEMTDGTKTSVGFAAGTNYRFTGIPKSFLSERKISWTNLKDYADKHPGEFNYLMARDNRFIFFKETFTKSPIGSIGVPVIPQLSIATDKKMLPPGALGLIRTNLPVRKANGGLALVRSTRLVLDQDTGSAIKGPGRVDIFMGTGQEAQQLASYTYSDGALYYLLARHT